MKVSIELIDELRSRVNVSYEEAKRVLEENDGDLISSIIQLEKEKKLNEPNKEETENQQFKSRKNKTKTDANYEKRYKEAYSKHEKVRENRHKECKSFFQKLFGLKFTVKNTEDKQIISMPFVLLILLCIPLFWLIAGLVIVGYFMGYRMDISGDKSTANDFEDLGRKAKDMANAVKNEFSEKNNKNENTSRNEEKKNAVDAEVEEVEEKQAASKNVSENDEEAEIIIE